MCNRCTQVWLSQCFSYSVMPPCSLGDIKDSRSSGAVALQDDCVTVQSRKCLPRHRQICNIFGLYLADSVITVSYDRQHIVIIDIGQLVVVKLTLKFD